MGVDIQRKHAIPEVNPIVAIKLETEGGSGSFITVRVRESNKTQISFGAKITNFGGGDNLNVSFDTAEAFAYAILDLLGGK